jgi:hypothetical protein
MSPVELSEKPAYFILLEWTDRLITQIRDFSHARYLIDGAQIALEHDNR